MNQPLTPLQLQQIMEKLPPRTERDEALSDLQNFLRTKGAKYLKEVFTGQLRQNQAAVNASPEGMAVHPLAYSFIGEFRKGILQGIALSSNLIELLIEDLKNTARLEDEQKAKEEEAK